MLKITGFIPEMSQQDKITADNSLVVHVNSLKRVDDIRSLMVLLATMEEDDFSMCFQFIQDAFALRGLNANPYDMAFNEVDIEDMTRYLGMKLQ